MAEIGEKRQQYLVKILTNFICSDILKYVGCSKGRNKRNAFVYRQGHFCFYEKN